MIRYSSEVTIARPPRAVYEALLDPDLYPEWTDMVDVSFEGGKASKVGTRGRFRMAKGPGKGMLDMELTELDPDRVTDRQPAIGAASSGKTSRAT